MTRGGFESAHTKAPLVKGSWRGAPEGLSPAAAAHGFPYEGKLSPEATDEVDCVTYPKVPHLIRHGYRRATFPS